MHDWSAAIGDLRNQFKSRVGSWIQARLRSTAAASSSIQARKSFLRCADAILWRNSFARSIEAASASIQARWFSPDCSHKPTGRATQIFHAAASNHVINYVTRGLTSANVWTNQLINQETTMIDSNLFGPPAVGAQRLAPQWLEPEWLGPKWIRIILLLFLLLVLLLILFPAPRSWYMCIYIYIYICIWLFVVVGAWAFCHLLYFGSSIDLYFYIFDNHFWYYFLIYILTHVLIYF